MGGRRRTGTIGRHVRLFVPMVIAVALLAGCDWSMFRGGPARTGSSPDTTISEGATAAGSLVEKWRASYTSPGSDLASTEPAVAAGVVYTASRDGMLHAFNAATGAPMWSVNAGGTVSPGDFSSPAVASGVVYIGGEDHNLYAFDASTGARLWTAPTGGSFSSSPAVANGVVYVTPNDRKLYAFDAAGSTNCAGVSPGKTCAPLWTGGPNETSNAPGTSPTVVNGRVYVAADAPAPPPAQGLVTGLKVFDAKGCGAATCQALSFNEGTGTDGYLESPAVTGSSAFAGDDNGGVAVFDLSAPASRASFEDIGGHNDELSSPALANGFVYYATGAPGGVYAFDTNRSRCGPGACDPAWTAPSVQPGAGGSPSPVVANGVVYVGGSDGVNDRLFALDAAGGNASCSGVAPNRICNPISSIVLGNVASSSPVVANGMIYLTGGGTLYAVGLEKVPPSTSIAIPANGATVSGTAVVLDASAADDVGVSKVEYHLTGGSFNDAVIGVATKSLNDWTLSWNSTSVPNGTYTLNSVATDFAGNTGRSPNRTMAVGNCGPTVSRIVCENGLPGSPVAGWGGSEDPGIEGFTAQFSVNHGETVQFKVSTAVPAYTIDIYRMGWYQGNGARKVATVTPDVVLPQVQPSCLSDPTTGLIDCGNWAVSASWTTPSGAVSGVYVARLRRTDTGAASSVFFVVRDDEHASKILFQTDDTTWQAYNSYGGESLYQGAPPVGRAYKVSYNRPFNDLRFSDLTFFSDQYPMIRFLERNGYDVSYSSGLDADQRGAEIREHKVYLSNGHDEYWSKQQRANVEAALAGGVNLAFFSGNEVFWKTRWEPSIDPSASPNRTLVCYKETHANAKIDPSPEWTGSWRDPRFSPPADGGTPENALTGTRFRVNGIRGDRIQVPAADGKMRFWRNTSVASLPVSGVATLNHGTLGYEWDEAPDDPARPPGSFNLSTTAVNITDGKYLLDYGSTYGNGTATHHLTMHRAPSGALVFGAGTVQWAWGLDIGLGTNSPDLRMQQATVNLLADMGAQPTALMTGLVAALASTDTTPPTATITAPAGGPSVVVGTPIVVSGTSIDSGGGTIGGVEVSTDNGSTWHPAEGRASWTYGWTPSAVGPVTILARSVDDSANVQPVPAKVIVNAAPS